MHHSNSNSNTNSPLNLEWLHYHERIRRNSYEEFVIIKCKKAGARMIMEDLFPVENSKAMRVNSFLTRLNTYVEAVHYRELPSIDHWPETGRS